MRSLRKAALAGATAAAVAFGSISVASAQDETNQDTTQAQLESSQTDQNQSSQTEESESTQTEESESSQTEDKDGSLSSKLNAALNLQGDKDADGRDIFGSTKDLETQPTWAKVLYALTIIGGIGSLIGLVLGPLDNFIKYGPLAN